MERASRSNRSENRCAEILMALHIENTHSARNTRAPEKLLGDATRIHGDPRDVGHWGCVGGLPRRMFGEDSFKQVLDLDGW
jgi:hypothetical protein